MPTSRRQDVATATVGAAGVGASGLAVHTAAERHLKDSVPHARFHGPSILARGTRKNKKLYLAGAAGGALSAAPLALGISRAVRPKPKPENWWDKVNPIGKNDSFLLEGVKGTGSALHERAQGATRKAPPKARLTALGTNAAAATAAGYGAKYAMRGAPKKVRAVATPVVGVIGGAAATPLSSKAVGRVSPGYEATLTGVRRKRSAPKRPSAQTFRDQPIPRSFRADVAKNDPAAYRAKVTAAGAVPGVGYLTGASAAGIGAKSDKDRRQAMATQGSSHVAGDAVGALAGAHATERAIHKYPKVGEQMTRIADWKSGKTAQARAKAGLKPKKAKPLKPAASSAGRAGKLVRSAVAPFKGKNAVPVALGAWAGSAAVGQAAQQAAISHNYKRHIAKVDGAPGLTRREQEKQLRRKSRLAHLTTANALVGSAGLATFAASKHPRFLAHKPALESATLGLGAAGGGLGAVGGFRRSKVERRDIAGQRRALGVAKSMPDASALHSPAGALKAKTYTSSSLRRTPRGRLVRVAAGVR